MVSQMQYRKHPLTLSDYQKKVAVVACQFIQLGTEPGVKSTCGIYSDSDSVSDRILPDT